MSPALTLVTVFGVHVAAMASPGPNVLLVTQAAVRHSRRQAVLMAWGVAAGALVMSSAAALGLGVVLNGVPALYVALKVAGGAYLVWLGVRMWRHAGSPMQTGTSAAAGRSFHSFRTGLLTNLTNPKSALFYGSVLTALLATNAPGWVPAAAVAIITLNALWWHVFLAVAFSSLPVQRAYARCKTGLDRAVGALLVAIGLRLFVSR